MSTDFKEYITAVFVKNGCEYKDIKDKLYSRFYSTPKERDRLEVLSHFYYFVCTPESGKFERGNNERDDFKIVGMTSLIEAMMEDDTYKDVFHFFDEWKKDKKNKNQIEDFAEFKNDYLKKYGCYKKIIKYFKEYIPKKRAKEIMNGIVRYKRESNEETALRIVCVDKKRESYPIKDLEELAKFLYQMRSDFVHGAKMPTFCTSNAVSVGIKVGKKTYFIKIGIDKLLNIFETSFVSYWKKKVETLSNV